jgi:hypothetical protein
MVLGQVDQWEQIFLSSKFWPFRINCTCLGTSWEPRGRLTGTSWAPPRNPQYRNSYRWQEKSWAFGSDTSKKISFFEVWFLLPAIRIPILRVPRRCPRGAREVPTRFPWGSQTCAINSKRPKLGAQKNLLLMFFSSQDLHGRHQWCWFHLSPGVSTPWAVGCRISAFSVHSGKSGLRLFTGALELFNCVLKFKNLKF